jgi:CelD/BcsL family acetyltransferase involved in cellulose biosynthesis
MQFEVASLPYTIARRMQVDLITSLGELDTLAAEWSELWHRAPNATPFQSPHWLLAWWKHFGDGELAVCTARDGDRLSALAPLYVVRDPDSDESLGMLLGTGVSDYLDVLSTADFAPLLARLLEINCQMWDLQQLRPSSPLLSATLPDGWGEYGEVMDQCPVLSLENAGDELQGLLSTHARKKLRYSRRTAEREAETVYEEATADSLDELLTALFELHAARWQQRGLAGVLADDVIQLFHRDAARRLLTAGALRMHAMRMNGRIVAVFYGFAHQSIIYYYLSGYDPSLDRLSLGTTLVAHAIEQAVRERATTFDFLRGAEEYKYSWGAVDRENRRRQLFRT